MAKNLLICFDGTWSKGKDPHGNGDNDVTNVWRLFQLATSGKDDASVPRCGDIYQQDKGSSSAYDAPQIAWYDAGVGTAWYDRIRGGLFGYGLDENILQGYRVLTELYEEGDKVFLCGFSRGAYTARSLAGLIAMCGLVDRCKIAKMMGSFDESFFADLMQDSCTGALTLYRDKGDGSTLTNEHMAEKVADFRKQFTRSIPIECIAVWDTVKALGLPSILVKCLPFGLGKRFNDAQYGFHDHALSPIVRHGYHALAIDEHRADFAPVLWDAPRDTVEDVSIDQRTGLHITSETQSIEQRWFSGAHSDVGGGYTSHALSDQSLAWMCTKLAACGLRLQSLPNNEESKAPPFPPITDSFQGFYALTCRLHMRCVRPLHPENSTVTLDPTVFARLITDPSYNPQNGGLTELLG